MPFVVFIAAPELDTLRAMHKAVVDAGLTTKLLTVRFLFLLHLCFFSPCTFFYWIRISVQYYGSG